MLGTVTHVDICITVRYSHSAVTVRLYFVFLERLLPDCERICVYRYIKYAQNFFVFSLEAALIKFVRKTVSIIKTQLVWPPTGAGPRQQFALVVKTWIIVSSGTQGHTRPPCTAPHSLCSGLYKILCEMTRIVCTFPWLPLAPPGACYLRQSDAANTLFSQRSSRSRELESWGLGINQVHCAGTLQRYSAYFLWQ